MQNLTTSATNADDLDKQVAVALCQILDCIELKTNLFGEMTVQQVQHWIKSRTAFYIAARDAGLAQLVQSDSSLLN